MGDVMKIAEARKSELENTIKSHEAEIADMREEIKSLSEFMEYGNDLMQRGGQTAQPIDAKPGTKIEQKSPENTVKDITKMDFEDDFDPFEAPAEEKTSISQLRPQSRPQSRPA